MNKDISRQVRFYKLPKEKIVDLNFILEGHDGFGILRTLNKTKGIVEILLAPDFADDLTELINDLAAEFNIIEISKPDGLGSILDE